MTYIFSEKILIAGTDENNVYCFELNDIIDSAKIEKNKSITYGEGEESSPIN